MSAARPWSVICEVPRGRVPHPNALIAAMCDRVGRARTRTVLLPEDLELRVVVWERPDEPSAVACAQQLVGTLHARHVPWAHHASGAHVGLALLDPHDRRAPVPTWLPAGASARPVREVLYEH